jgi:hypothetical protein
VRSEELFGGSSGGYNKPFGVERGSGYEPKTIDVRQSPLTCPKCGKPCAGTAERKTCTSCGFSTVAQQTVAAASAATATENLCPKCEKPLTIIGDSKKCNACGWSL